MKVSFGGIGECVATFYNSDSSPVNPGDLVKISASGQVAACQNGDPFVGFCISADNLYAAVQISGFVSLPFIGTPPALGHSSLAAASNSSVKAASPGTQVLVIEADSDSVGFML